MVPEISEGIMQRHHDYGVLDWLRLCLDVYCYHFAVPF